MKYFSVFILLIVAACAAVTSFSTKGEEIYYEKCGGCHRIYNINEFTIEEWKKEIKEMSFKAKLKKEEEKLLREYLIPTDSK